MAVSYRETVAYLRTADVVESGLGFDGPVQVSRVRYTDPRHKRSELYEVAVFPVGSAEMATVVVPGDTEVTVAGKWVAL